MTSAGSSKSRKSSRLQAEQWHNSERWGKVYPGESLPASTLKQAYMTLLIPHTEYFPLV